MVQRIEKIMSGNSSIDHNNNSYVNRKTNPSPSRNHSSSNIQSHRPSNSDFEMKKYNFLSAAVNKVAIKNVQNVKKISRNQIIGS